MRCCTSRCSPSLLFKQNSVQTDTRAPCLWALANLRVLLKMFSQRERTETYISGCLLILLLFPWRLHAENERHLFGKPNTDYDFASKDPSQAKKELQQNVEQQVCIGSTSCVSYALYYGVWVRVARHKLFACRDRQELCMCVLYRAFAQRLWEHVCDVVVVCVCAYVF